MSKVIALVHFKRTARLTLFFLGVLFIAGFVACAGSADESDYTTESIAFTEAADEESDSFAMADSGEFASAGSESQMAESVSSPSDAMQESETGEASADGASTGFFQGSPLSNEVRASVQPQNRVIVRTVDMGIIVPDVPKAADAIIELAESSGGWQVDSERSRQHQAWLSVRVPAETLDDFVSEIRKMADQVESETSTSQDVTDEFVDNQSRLTGLRATEERLLEFLGQSEKVEDALKVQAELTRIQLEIEAIQGRLRFLSQTAAFSLVNLTLTTKPGELPVEIGADAATYRVDLPDTFRATFEAPNGVEDFTFTWDFGDGTEPVNGTRTAPTTNSGERVTSTVSHAFFDVEQAPYIVQLNITGIGDTGLFEGSDTLIATVTEIQGIEVFAGENHVVDEGDEVEYSGSFTRPESLWDFEFHWDFGDGSATVVGVPAEGSTRALAAHTYSDYRPNSYKVLLTVTAQSEAGEVKGTGSFRVQVNEVEGFIVAGWDVGGTAKSAVRALTAIGQFLLIILIWVGILSPVWLVILAAVILLPRLRRRFWPGRYEWSTTGRRQGGGQNLTHPGAEQVMQDGGTIAESQIAGAGSSAQPGAAGLSAGHCNNCGRDMPAADTSGNPPKYCPFCGAETGTPDDG